MAIVAQRDQRQQNEISSETVPEDQRAETLHAKLRRRHRSHNDPDIGDEKRWIDAFQSEAAQKTTAEPENVHRVHRHSSKPEINRSVTDEILGVDRKLHRRHKDRGSNARDDRILQIAAGHFRIAQNARDHRTP